MSARDRNGRPRIVVGYDGSQPARAAVAWAADRSGRSGKVYVVHSLGAPADEPLPYDKRHERGKAILNALILEGGNALIDVDYELELVAGEPAGAIAEAAREHDADEIVIGSRGFGRVRSALGSVSHELLHVADRPVMVIPYGAVRQNGRLAS